MKKELNRKIRRVDHLLKDGLIHSDQVSELNAVVEKFNLSITHEMVKEIDKNNPNDPIALQFIPNKQELKISEEELDDPIGDNDHTPVKGVIHRYPDRCLFLPMTVCSVYCRFCFRREKVGSGNNGLNRHELENAFQYIGNTQEIREVILTGGDPLFMSHNLLKEIFSRLVAMKHVRIIRIHTRIPIVDPDRITENLLKILKCGKPVYIVIHANHSKEFTSRAKRAVAMLADNGIPLLSQNVLLKGINDNIETLTELMYTFVENRIKPYYLHHGDFAKGTSHFRTSIAEGQELMKKLRGNVSGLCQPVYVLDVPGGYGKVPINHNYIQLHKSCNENEECLVEDYKGRTHTYPPKLPIIEEITGT